MSSKQVHVAVGVIKDGQQILLARRHAHQHQGGLWEFPGGKVEAGETVFAALQRELLEEVHLYIHQASPLLTIAHDYGDKQVLLDVWLCEHFSGTAEGREGQELRWVALSELPDYDFPAANATIVKALLT